MHQYRVTYLDDAGEKLATLSGDGPDFTAICDRFFRDVGAAAQTVRDASGVLESPGLTVTVTVRAERDRLPKHAE